MFHHVYTYNSMIILVGTLHRVTVSTNNILRNISYHRTIFELMLDSRNLERL